MKISALTLLAVVGTAAAGKPQLSLSVRDGSFDDLGGLDPTLSWSTSGTSGDYELEFGVEANVRATTDIASLPKSYWGKASTDMGAWGVTARADIDACDLTAAEIEIDAENADDDLSVKILASASASSFSVSKVEATKTFLAGDTTVTVNPSYDVSSGETVVEVGYDFGDISIDVTASNNGQVVKVSHQVDADIKVSPSVALQSGDVSVEFERSLGDGNSVVATVTPNDSVDVEWNDADWTASINLPFEGNTLGSANVSIKRELKF